MLNILFAGLFSSSSSITVVQFLLCLAISLVCGLIIALSYQLQNRSSSSFTQTLALLPAVVCVVIMLVSGSIGAGVAVAGTFSLVRFRSAPGTAREICSLFLSMAAGLICGMGYLGCALLFTLLLTLVQYLYQSLGLGMDKNSEQKKTVRITLPESLDYTGVFRSVMAKYTSECKLRSVKTTNMGSLLRLTYDLTLKDNVSEKAFLDELRCRNGNLEISISLQETETLTEL